MEPRDEGCRRSPITLEGLLERRGAAALCEEEEDNRELATSDDVLPAVARAQRELEFLGFMRSAGMPPRITVLQFFVAPSRRLQDASGREVRSDS